MNMIYSDFYHDFLFQRFKTILNKDFLMAYYWVNVGTSFNEVKLDKFLWAPSYTVKKNGKRGTKSDWDIVKQVQTGDVIFCCKDKHIVYVAVATKDAFASPRPESRISLTWNEDGNQIDVALTVLKSPLELSIFKPEFNDRFNHLCSQLVFDKNLSRCQIYMASIPELAAAFLLNLIGEDSLDIQQTIASHRSGNRIPKRKSKGADKEVIAKSRVGQGLFRRDVLNLWDSTCPITNVNHAKLLIASHILPWQLSTSEEKVDGYNGLPLSPNADKLFDNGLISFSDNGDMLLSNEITQELLIRLGIEPLTKILKVKPQNKPYLQRHRELYGFSMAN
jgi:putative restriction endonuclease